LGFCLAANSSPVTAQIEVQGNHRVSEEAIRDHISSQVGQPFDPDRADGDRLCSLEDMVGIVDEWKSQQLA
jgi:hypothetical protein